MSTNPETAIVNRIIKHLKAVPGCCAEKRHGNNYGKAGQPDISACIRSGEGVGHRLEIEVKVPSAWALANAAERVARPVMMDELEAMQRGEVRKLGNFPTDLQMERLREWSAAGALACVLYSAEAVKVLIAEAQGRG